MSPCSNGYENISSQITFNGHFHFQTPPLNFMSCEGDPSQNGFSSNDNVFRCDETTTSAN